MPRPAIRPARPDDLSALLRMVHALAAHHGDDAAVTEADLARDLFSARPWMQVLLAETPDGPVGYAALLPIAQLQKGVRGMELHHLYVAPDDRGSGIGGLLIEAAGDHARRQGCSYMSVGTHPGNLAAQSFYTRRGFSPRPLAGARFARVLAA